MEIISGTTEFYLEKETAVAIGKFDGVHLGHRRLLEEILNQKKNGLMACVFTFDPVPAVLFGQSDGKELTTKEEKRLMFERMGVDVLIEFPLTLQTAGILPREFVNDVLSRRMNVRFIAAGSDISFGAGGSGNANLLQKMSGEFMYTFSTIEKVCLEGREVSSTYIRAQVEAGNMEIAAKMLGTPYPIFGTVAHGNQIGRTLGFPTVNLLPGEHKLLPPNGVYYSEVRHLGRIYRAISNVGYKPTVTKDRIMGVESYIYDFNENLYDEPIEVYLQSFKRPEQKFTGLEDLKAQLRQDIVAGASFTGISS